MGYVVKHRIAAHTVPPKLKRAELAGSRKPSNATADPARANLTVLDGKQPVPAGEKEAHSYFRRPVGSYQDR
jgi:hypothetical protein